MSKHAYLFVGSKSIEWKVKEIDKLTVIFLVMMKQGSDVITWGIPKKSMWFQCSGRDVSILGCNETIVTAY